MCNTHLLCYLLNELNCIKLHMVVCEWVPSPELRLVKVNVNKPSVKIQPVLSWINMTVCALVMCTCLYFKLGSERLLAANTLSVSNNLVHVIWQGQSGSW